jgi:translation initiation factor 1
MSTSKRKPSNPQDSKQSRVVYSEFGNHQTSPALERGIQELPPEQQKLRTEVSSKGRKGKTVTIVSGFQCKPETLATLLKQLKTDCGAGGTVKEMTIEIQGDHRDKIVQKLTQLNYKVR